MCNLEDFNHLTLADPHKRILKEELTDWHQTYLPPGGLHGKNVLDIGAGCGETSLFFLNHGAASVRPIEMNPQYYQMMKDNFAHDSRISWNGPFKVDFIKSDCEGGERYLVVEAHFPFYLRHLNRNVGHPLTTLWRFEPFLPLKSMVLADHAILVLHQVRIQIAHFIRRTLASEGIHIR